jgi:hypothetical protein
MRSPERPQEIGEIVTKAGASFVDGGIWGSGQTSWNDRLYLSGTAPEIAELFPRYAYRQGHRPKPGAASALKVVYAAWTKSPMD